jgi:hypothetical protein
MNVTEVGKRSLPMPIRGGPRAPAAAMWCVVIGVPRASGVLRARPTPSRREPLLQP